MSAQRERISMTSLGQRVGRCVALLVLLLAIACGTEASYRGRNAADWIRQLETDRDSLQRRAAADALGRILEIDPGSARVMNALVRALADTSDEVRLAAGTALVQDRRLRGAAIPGLVRALGDSAHPHTREHAAELLGATTPRDAGLATPGLIAALEDRDPGVRAAVTAALVRIASRAPATVDALRQFADSATPVGQSGARRAIALIAGDSVGRGPRAP